MNYFTYWTRHVEVILLFITIKLKIIVSSLSEVTAESSSEPISDTPFPPLLCTVKWLWSFNGVKWKVAPVSSKLDISCLACKRVVPVDRIRIGISIENVVWLWALFSADFISLFVLCPISWFQQVYRQRHDHNSQLTIGFVFEIVSCNQPKSQVNSGFKTRKAQIYKSESMHNFQHSSMTMEIRGLLPTGVDFSKLQGLSSVLNEIHIKTK